MAKPLFDAEYYRRYYTNHSTAVVTKASAREASDMTGYFRPARWYLKRLEAAGFRNAGMGLFVSDRFDDFDPFALDVRWQRQ